MFDRWPATRSLFSRSLLAGICCTPMSTLRGLHPFTDFCHSPLVRATVCSPGRSPCFLRLLCCLVSPFSHIICTGSATCGQRGGRLSGRPFAASRAYASSTSCACDRANLIRPSHPPPLRVQLLTSFSHSLFLPLSAFLRPSAYDRAKLLLPFAIVLFSISLACKPSPSLPASCCHF